MSRIRRQSNNLSVHPSPSTELWEQEQAFTTGDLLELFAAQAPYGGSSLLADAVHNYAADGWNYGSLQLTARIQQPVSATNEGNVPRERAVGQDVARIATSALQEHGTPVESEAKTPRYITATGLHDESNGVATTARPSFVCGAGATPATDGSPANAIHAEVQAGSSIVAGPNWQDIKIGAGGWLTGIDIAPDNTKVVRTDTYGAYIWNGTEWRQLVTTASMPSADVRPGNAAGVYEIRIAPSDSNILYMQYLGNVYRSNNKGVTWSKTAFPHVVTDPNDPHRMNGQKMAVDPNKADVVYVGTPQDGLFITKDGGTSWQKISALPVSAQDASGQYPGITGISFDPTSGTAGGKTNKIFASSYGHGVYTSTDGGLSWTALAGGPSDVEYAAISSTGVYYAVGNNNSSLWKFTNGAWTKLSPDNSQGIHTVSIDPFNASHIIVATPGGNLNQSVDGGATWGGINWAASMSATDVPWLASTEPYMSSGGMVFDQLVANKLWAADGVGVWNAAVPANMTWSTPLTWVSQSAGIEQLVANEILVAPGGKPIVASWDRPFFYVNDLDSYPTAYGVGNPHPFSAGWSLDYASSNPNFIVGINDWWGIEQSGYSSDGGQTWHMFPTMPSFAGKTIGGTISASSSTDIVWAPANGIAPQYTKDGGQTWNPVILPGVTDWSGFHWAYYLDKQTVAADRVLKDTFYLYYNGVYKTIDGGDTWVKVFNQEISSFSTFNSRIETVPGKAGHLFFTGGPQGGVGDPDPADQAFYHSTDGGVSWTAIGNVREVQTFGFGASATPDGYPAIYIVGWVNSVYGIWQSNDDAHSWTMIGDYPQGSLDSIKTISGDPNIYGQVYVGFTGSGYAYLPGAPEPTPQDHSPVVTALNQASTHNQSIATSSLFAAGDSDGDTITTHALKNVTGNGRFVVDGVVHTNDTEILLTAAQLAKTTYQSGSGSDQLSMGADDGTLWNEWQNLTITAPNVEIPLIPAQLGAQRLYQVVSGAEPGGANLDAFWSTLQRLAAPNPAVVLTMVKALETSFQKELSGNGIIDVLLQISNTVACVDTQQLPNSVDITRAQQSLSANALTSGTELSATARIALLRSQMASTFASGYDQSRTHAIESAVAPLDDLLPQPTNGGLTLPSRSTVSPQANTYMPSLIDPTLAENQSSWPDTLNDSTGYPVVSRLAPPDESSTIVPTIVALLSQYTAAGFEIKTFEGADSGTVVDHKILEKLNARPLFASTEAAATTRERLN